MGDSIQLIGAEEVSRAASRMESAADTMRQAAASIDDTFGRFGMRLEEYIQRLEHLDETRINIENARLQAGAARRG